MFWKRKRKEAAPTVCASRRQGLSFGLASDVGRVRSSNQDHLLAIQASFPGPAGQTALGLFIVADGMGGHAGGATASARAVEAVAAYVLEGLLLPVLRGDPPEALQDLLHDAVHAANRRVLEEATQQRNDMGTTVTAALLLEERCYIGHVGDSRLYTYGAEGLQRHTRDHSMVARLEELGQISPEEAQHHPKRNYLYQSVGQQEEIDVDSTSFSLEGCSHLLLCCDGLWGVVQEEEIVRLLTAGEEPQETAERLVAQANQAGGEDNISVIVVALAVPAPDN